MGYSNNHIFLGNHVFYREVSFLRHNLRASGVSVDLSDFKQFLPDDLHLLLGTAENKPQLFNESKYLGVLYIDLFALHTGKTLQTHLKNSLRLEF